MTNGVRVVARRGDVERAPENTLPAFESAIARGADAVELDVHLTADGKPVVHHFYSLGSSDNGAGLVCEKTLAELKRLDSGGWFSPQYAGVSKPSLSEVLDLCRARVSLEIDLKDPGPEFLQKVIHEIENLNLAGSVELATAHTPLLSCIKGLDPKFRTGTFFYEPPTWMPLRLAQRHVLDWAKLLKIDAVHLHLSLITEDFVRRLHERGFTVHGSNLDSPEDICGGIRAGIDAFSTGHLGLALQLRDQL